MSTLRIASAFALVGALSCRNKPSPSTGTATGSTHRLDAAIVLANPVATSDAPIADATTALNAACRSGEASVHDFRFGTLTAPTGWYWRRTEEGDDQSGILLDDKGRVRMRYYELSFDEKVGDSCDAHRGVRAIKDDHAHGVAFRSCELDDGRHCFSLHGLANLCTELPEDSAFSPIEMIRAVVPKKRR